MRDFKKLAKISVLVIGLISLFLLNGIRDIGFDYDFTAFYAEGDTDTEFFDEHQGRYGSDNDFVFISLESKKGVFNTEFLKRASAFVGDLEADSLVETATCLTNMSEYIKTPFSRAAIKVPYLTICDTCDYKQDSARIFQRPELKTFFINSDATGLLVRIDHQQLFVKEEV